MTDKTALVKSSDEEHTYHIPAGNMGKLRQKFDKMNRKAAKIGCPPVSFEIINKYKRVHPDYVQQQTVTGLPDHYFPQLTMYEIKINGEGPKIKGWKFVGTLDLNTLPGSTIVKTVPGESVPKQYFTHDGSCDHCNKIRYRNETFVLEGVGEHAGSHRVVGRNCLKDFFGHDPSQVARLLSSIWKVLSDLEEDERGGWGGGHYDPVFDHKRVLAVTAAVIKLDGWKAKSACEFGGTPTASLVIDVFMPPRMMPEEERAAYQAWLTKLDYDNPKFETEATAAMEWLEEQEANNDYMHNLHQIASADAVPLKMFGFWCSLMAAYQRAQERLIQQRAAKKGKKNEYLPGVAVKDKVEIEVTLLGLRSFDSMYGTVHIHRMLDSEGRTVVWFANARPTMEEGKKYRIRGTVKKLDEYEDWKQTTLTRVRVLNEVE